MSVAAGGYPESLRALAFSDPESELWGAAWMPPSSTAPVVLASHGQATSLSGALEGEGADEPWRLETGDGELMLEGLAGIGRSPHRPASGL